MKIVLDTNVLISGTFWTGNSFKILEMIGSNKVSLFLSDGIINEYYETINSDEILDKINNKNLISNEIIQKVISNAFIVKPNQKLTISEDPDDNMVLECAFEGQVDFIITYDNHLLKLKEFNNFNNNIKIVAPEEFLRIFENEHRNKAKK